MSKPQRAQIALTALLASMLCPAIVRAAPGDATRLEYARSERAARCPDRDALKSAVSKRLGYDPFFPAARQTIVVEITDMDDDLRAQMRLLDEHGIIVGSRELKDKIGQCDELVASLALAISIALDASAALGAESDAKSAAASVAAESSTPVVAAPDESAAAAPETAAQSTPHSPPHRERDPRGSSPTSEGHRKPIPWTVRAAGFSTRGVAPSPAYGVRVGAGVRADWFQLLAEFSDQFPVLNDAGSASARLSLYTGTLAPCYVYGDFSGCGLLNLGSLYTEGVNVANPIKQRSLSAALGARVEFTPRLYGPLHLLVAADALRSLTPTTLRLRGEEVWKTPTISGALAIGLALQFP